MQDPSGLIYGQKCECDNQSCPKDPENEEICGGIGRLLQSVTPNACVAYHSSKAVKGNIIAIFPLF